MSVTDLDISPHALESARRNFALNKNFPAVAACRHETVQADAFEWIGKSHAKFDLIVLDPPSLASALVEREGDIRAYERLNSLGIRLLAPDGILVVGSCSAHVPAPEFFDAVRQAATKSGRKFSALKTDAAPAGSSRRLQGSRLFEGDLFEADELNTWCVGFSPNSEVSKQLCAAKTT